MRNIFGQRKHTARIRFFVTALFASVAATSTHAVNLDFGKIGSTESGFQQYWGLSAEEVKAYNNYMAIAGKYRHKEVDPLLVLSMIADNQEDKLYYAKKAAEHEHAMVKREIEAAWMLSEAMSESRLSDAMQAFTDNLTGIETLGYVPAGKKEIVWEADDQWLLFLDERCLNVVCINQFVSSVPKEALQDGILRQVVMKTDIPLEEPSVTLLQTIPGIAISRFDPIEHSYLDNLVSNQALHVRADKMLAVIPVSQATSEKNGGDAGKSRTQSVTPQQEKK